MSKPKDPLILETSGEWHLRSDGNGRTVVGRIIPFLEPAVVIERGERYREQFLPGCMTRMMQFIGQRGNPGYITLNVDHDESMDKLIGFARAVEQREDGGYAEFELYPDRNLEKVRSMLEESHRGLSVLFDDLAAPKEMGGVRSRQQISIRHVAATSMPVYAGAAVLAMRSEDSGPDTEAIMANRPALTEWTSYLEGLS